VTDRESFEQILVPDAVRGICERLAERGFRAWIVGGCVRDALLRNLGLATNAGQLATDWDIATDAPPEQVRKAFKRAIPTGIEHGTITVVVDKEHYEVTTLRADIGYSDGRRPDKVEFVSDIVGDLARRDFTINAIAYDVLAGELSDPFGGISDLKLHRLRAVGNPLDRFAEDGLRVLRAARFMATLELEFDPATENAIRPSLASYRKVSAERIRDEWLKTLKARRPSIAFEIMRRHGMLEITCPELVASTITSSTESNLWSLALRSLDLAPRTREIQLAALLHVAGKESSAGTNPGATSAAIVDRLLRNLRFSNQERERIVALVRHHDPDYRSTWSDADVRRWLHRIGPELATDLRLLLRAIASAQSGNTDERMQLIEQLGERATRELDAKVPLALRDLAIGGADLIRDLALQPGRRIGELLEQLLDEVITDPSLNQREALLERAQALIKASR
jgi:tRNA nucleotidyltransferase (CCA-adding enzyme)